MNSNRLAYFACAVVILALAPSIVQAQTGQPPLGGSGGFRQRGFRVIGVEGCLSNGRPAPSGTPGYAAQIVHDRLEAVLNGNPVNRSSTELAYRDNNGVTYLQITLPPMGASQAPRTVICINDPNLNIRLVVNPDPSKPSARQYKLPAFKPPPWNTNSNAGGGPNPSAPGANVSVTHPAPPASVLPQINQYCPDAQTTQITRKTPDGAIVSQRVYCPSLFLNFYSQISDPHGVSTTTTTITATGNQVDLSKLPVPYPLLNNYTVMVVDPGKRRGPPFADPAGPPQP